jgi:AsmA protein
MSGFIRRIINFSLMVVGVAIVFIIVIIGVFITTFDANQYKQDMSDLVREETGRHLEFYSDVGLTFYPVLGMKLGALSLSNAEGFGGEPMIKVNKVSVSVDVASILVFSPKIDQLILDGLEVNLQKNKQGITNWDDLIKPHNTQSSNIQNTAKKSSATQDSADDEPMKLSGAFGGLNITNAQLSWVDEQVGAEYKIQHLNIKTGRITPNAPFALAIEVALESKGSLNAKVDMKSQVQYMFDKAQFNISGLVLNVAATGKQLPRGKMQARITSDFVELNPQQRSAALKGLVLVVDANRLAGEINVSDYGQPALSFKLAADSLDVDTLFDVRPALAQPSSGGGTQGGEASEQDIQIGLPMALFRTAEIEGELLVKQLKVQNLLFDDIDVGISAANGIVNLDPITMNLYDGSVSGVVRLDARSDLPKYQVNKEIRSVQVEKLLTDFMGEGRISGVLDADAVITTHGEWLSELKKNSHGKVKLAVKDGALNGFNLRYSIDKAKAQFKGQVLPPEEARKTDFSSLELSGKINNGVIESKDLNLQAPIMRVGGEGQANLISNTVDFLVRAKLVGTIAGQNGGGADDLKGLTIPIRIYGPFADPKVDVQLEDMLKRQAAEKVAAVKAKLKAELDAQKAKLAQQKVALQQQLREKAAKLKETKRLELENQKKVLKDKLKAELNEAKAKLLGGFFN